MDSIATTLLRLNLETQAHHAAADQLWTPLLAADVSKWQYLARLAIVYGFEAPLESALAYTPNLRIAIDVRNRFRAGLVAQDLISLGLSASAVAELPQCYPVAPFGNPLEALGWLYVSERTTLQHEAVLRNVTARIADISGATSYLRVYDGFVGSRWHELGTALDRSVRTERAMDEIVTGADAAFRCLASWSRVTPISQVRVSP